MNTFLKIATSWWGDDMPDWIERLAAECDRSSQNQAAKQIGRSAALVSNVLRNKYAGDMEAVEDRVRGVLMRETIECPALGTTDLMTCRDWRARSNRHSGNNARNVMMYRACNRCPRNRRTTA